MNATTSAQRYRRAVTSGQRPRVRNQLVLEVAGGERQYLAVFPLARAGRRATRVGKWSDPTDGGRQWSWEQAASWSSRSLGNPSVGDPD
jgi:hypothetical protein